MGPSNTLGEIDVLDFDAGIHKLRIGALAALRRKRDNLARRPLLRRKFAYTSLRYAESYVFYRPPLDLTECSIRVCVGVPVQM